MVTDTDRQIACKHDDCHRGGGHMPNKITNRNGPGVGLLAGNVCGIYKNPVQEWQVCSVWACDCCGNAINRGTRCLPCEIHVHWYGVSRFARRGRRYVLVNDSRGAYYVAFDVSSKKGKRDGKRYN